jgi:type IV pilus assembly protein PilQ
MRFALAAPALTLALSLAAPGARGTDPDEGRVSLDVREAPVQGIVGLLAKLGGIQVVFDHDVQCALTVRLHSAVWLEALDTTLRACGLGHEGGGGVIRVAPVARLQQEAAQRRALDEARNTTPSGDLALFRLSYARPEAMAPLLQPLIAPRGRVTLDPRTNTLIVTY